MTKLMTAISIMQLVERGLVGLDDDVGKIVPQLANKDVLVGFEDDVDGKPGKPILKKSIKAITLRLLLTHSSGFPYVYPGAPIGKWSEYMKRDENALNGSWEAHDIPLIFEPDTSWSYGCGIDWAGRVLEVLTDTTLNDYMKANIWSKLGMNETTFHPENFPELQAKQMDVGFRAEPNGALASGTLFWKVPAPIDQGGAGIFSTINDYAKLLTELVTSGTKLLSEESQNEIFKPQLTDNTALNENASSYGFGALLDENTKTDYTLAGATNIDPVKGARARNTVYWSGMVNGQWVSCSAISLKSITEYFC
jgi:CubicO group peptidase (beta-lactamase class C family)